MKKEKKSNGKINNARYNIPTETNTNRKQKT